MAAAALAQPPLKADPRLIVPLDVPTADEARALVASLGDTVSFYKVGLELFATEGMALARASRYQRIGFRGLAFIHGAPPGCRCRGAGRARSWPHLLARRSERSRAPG